MNSFLQLLATQSALPIWLLILVLVWSLLWKGIALWRAARLKQPIWFILFLVVQTLGILEILYLFLFSKINLAKKRKKRR